jgi:RNA polymerase sigma-70 factor, ECF subfamily
VLVVRTVTRVTRTDDELLREHLSGDRHAFGELVRRHERVLWTVARRCLDDDRDAAEAVQDTLLRAHQSAGRYRNECAVRTWLMRILLNRCRDQYRYNSRRVAERRLDADELARIPARRDPIEDHLVGLALRRAMASLSFEHRAVILLVTVLGYPAEEVAVTLGVSVGTVKSRGARARQRLRELLSERAPRGADERDTGEPTASAGQTHRLTREIG